MTLSTRLLLGDAFALARRNASHVRQIPEKLLDVTLQPVMFVLLFAFVFGNVIHIPGGSYREYLIGGILVQTLAFGLMGPGVSIATDLGEGFVDRVRSLPTSRGAYLLGHVMAEFGASMIALTVLSATGLLVGWRIHTDVPHAVAAFAILAFFALAMICLGTLVGIVARSPDGVTGVAFMTAFPLTFLANTFVPADGLPPVLRTIAEWNPVSALVASVRTLFGNPTALGHHVALPLHHPVLASLLWCTAILVVVVPLGLRRFEARTTD